MDFKQIQELIKIVGKSDLSEISIEQDNFKITLKKATTQMVVQQPMRPAAVEHAPVQAAAAEAAAPEITDIPMSPKKEKSADNGKYVTIKSPMVGTFYRSPSPDKDAFVKVGDTIAKGDHICIIEAMKLFNEIESEVDG